MVRREPVPPGVQVAPDAAGAALPRVRRRRARAGSRSGPACELGAAPLAATRSRLASIGTSACRALLRSLFLELCRHPEPVRARSAPSPTASPPSSASSGSTSTRTTPGRASTRTTGNLSAGSEPTSTAARRSSSARTSTRCRRRGRSSRSSRTASCATPPARSSAPTTRRRSPSMLEAARRDRRRNGARTRASSSLFTHEGGGRAARRRRVRPHAARGRARLRLRPGGADRRGGPRRALRQRTMHVALPRPAPHTPGSPRRRAARRSRPPPRAIADLRLGRLDESTTANVGAIAGGTARNIVPEWCSLEAEARSHDERQARRPGPGDARHVHLRRAASPTARSRPRSARPTAATASAATTPLVRLAGDALERCGYEPTRRARRRRRRRERLQRARAPVRQPRERDGRDPHGRTSTSPSPTSSGWST